MKALCKNYIQEHFEEFIDMATSVCMWSNNPNAENCASIEKALRSFIAEGNQASAALYFMISAYDNHEDTFSEIFAVKELLTANAVSEYHKILESELGSIVEPEYYEYLYTLPLLLCNKYLSDTCTNNEECTE